MTKLTLLAASVLTLSGAGLLMPTLTNTATTAFAVQTPPPPRPGDRPPRPGDRAPPPGGMMDDGPMGQMGPDGRPKPPGKGPGAMLMNKPVTVECMTSDGSKMSEKGMLMNMGPDWVVIDSPEKGVSALNARFVTAVRADKSAPMPKGGQQGGQQGMQDDNAPDQGM